VAFPIVSHARKTRTRLFSLSIFVVANARAKVTANGKPSGTATTMIVTVTIRISRNSWPLIAGEAGFPDMFARNRIKRMVKRRAAALDPDQHQDTRDG
jgi:hypothetical protein